MTKTNSDNSIDQVGVKPIDLSAEQLESIARVKATCPFIGAAVKSRDLEVRNSAERPLAAVEKVAALGDSGGGDLGRRVLRIFAIGNHGRMPGPSGGFDASTPDDMFSLDFGGSQGAHPGHSGILLGDPTKIDAGRFSADDFARLAKHADENGLISVKATGEFIAENLVQDPNSKVLPVGALTSDILGLVGEVVDEVRDSIVELLGRETEEDEDKLLEKLTKLAGEDNLIGSAGEFGLLFAFLANRPGLDGEDGMAIRLEDVEQMFVHHRFPDGWETWPKKATDWISATSKIAFFAGKAYLVQGSGD